VFNADDLIKKLKEIEDLIRARTNPDGSYDFDPVPPMIMLEACRRIINNEDTDDK